MKNTNPNKNNSNILNNTNKHVRNIANNRQELVAKNNKNLQNDLMKNIGTKNITTKSSLLPDQGISDLSSISPSNRTTKIVQNKIKPNSENKNNQQSNLDKDNLKTTREINQDDIATNYGNDYQNNIRIDPNKTVNPEENEEFNSQIVISQNNQNDVNITSKLPKDDLMPVVAKSSNDKQLTTIVKRGDVFNLKLNLKGKNVEGLITVHNENNMDSIANVIHLDKASQTNLNIIFKDNSKTDIDPDQKRIKNKPLNNPIIGDSKHSHHEEPNVVVVQCMCSENLPLEELKNIPISAFGYDDGDADKKYFILVPYKNKNNEGDEIFQIRL